MSFSFGGLDVDIDSEAKAVFDPGFGYGIYLPSKDFAKVTL
jgi:hypothetical protein